MDEECGLFLDKCELNGISVYNANLYGGEHVSTTLIKLDNPNDIIDYCIQNNIKTLFLVKEFKEPVVQPIIEKDVIKEKITDFFNRKKPVYSHSLVPSNITQEFHESLLTDILNGILIEIDNDAIFNEVQIKTSENSSDEEIVESISFYAFNLNCVISATIFSNLDDDCDEEDSDIITEKDILNKYARLVNEKLRGFYSKVRTESDQIRKHTEDTVLKEIEGTVKANPDLVKMQTQKSRNEYADRLYAIWYREKGQEWLTKLAVRSIVDLQYVYVTGGRA
ncbi:MAG: hypothetical protein IJ649_09585 [Oscillospiraceae bacterium]|nr:hypothetical protein [Oscillospiraceae bacterium]